MPRIFLQDFIKIWSRRQNSREAEIGTDDRSRTLIHHHRDILSQFLTSEVIDHTWVQKEVVFCKNCLRLGAADKILEKQTLEVMRDRVSTANEVVTRELH